MEISPGQKIADAELQIVNTFEFSNLTIHSLRNPCAVYTGKSTKI